MKQRLEGKTAWYDYFISQRWLAANSEGYMDPIPDSERDNYPPVETPIVITHPRTGRKSLFFNTQRRGEARPEPGPGDQGAAQGAVERTSSRARTTGSRSRGRRTSSSCGTTGRCSTARRSTTPKANAASSTR